MASVRHLEFEKFRFLSIFHGRSGNLHLCTKFDQNRIIHGCDMEIKPFSKWRPSAIMNLRKLQFWSRDLYRYVILHLISEFCVERRIRRRNIAKKRYSIWRQSAMFSLKNFDFFLSNFHARNGNSHQCVKLDRNRIIRD